jgi:hypothetical protein
LQIGKAWHAANVGKAPLTLFRLTHCLDLGVTTQSKVGVHAPPLVQHLGPGTWVISVPFI